MLIQYIKNQNENRILPILQGAGSFLSELGWQKHAIFYYPLILYVSPCRSSSANHCLDHNKLIGVKLVAIHLFNWFQVNFCATSFRWTFFVGFQLLKRRHSWQIKISRINNLFPNIIQRCKYTVREGGKKAREEVSKFVLLIAEFRMVFF